MKGDVFGLGLAQFLLTMVVVSSLALGFGAGFSQAFILGAALALSSSALALQLLDERSERSTLYGRSAFGILIFQDLAVPLVLVLLPMLGGDLGGGLLPTLTKTMLNAMV